MMHFMIDYGYWVLFASLLLGLLAIPLPVELILGYAGLLVFQGQMNWIVGILTAALGSTSGMIAAYWIGYAVGKPFIHKYGRRIHFGPEQLDKTSRWFERYGNNVLIIGFFIPGFRHFTGYFSGITRMPFRSFTIYSFIGSTIWVGLFISLGRVLGPKWEAFHSLLSRYLIIAGIIAAAAVLITYLYKQRRKQIIAWTVSTLNKGVISFHSLGRVKLLVVIASAAFLVLFGFMIGIIQDYLGNESAQFDTVVFYLFENIFVQGWTGWMDLFTYFAAMAVLIPITTITLLWIIFKGKDRLLESGFLLVVLWGGYLFNGVLRSLFQRLGPHSTDLMQSFTFPSEQTFITLTLYGFCAYLLFRHYGATAIRIIAPVVVVVIAFTVGVSLIYFEVQYPSDVIAGYVFGGVWLTLNIVLLEIFRVMRRGNLRISG